MVRVRQPATPSLNDGEAMPYGFHHLISHNAGTPFFREKFEYDGGGQLISSGDSTFSSPGPQYQDDSYLHGGQRNPYAYQQSYRKPGLDLNYDEYLPEGGQYDVVQDDNQLFYGQYRTPGGSPPRSVPRSIPRSVPTAVVDTMRTRSGLTVHRAIQPNPPAPQAQAQAQAKAKPSKTPRTRKVKKDTGKPEVRVAKLQKPLSELTKSWDHVPVVDIEAYVNRSAEERRKEVEEGKIPGKVKRPMNSFMLYRKAYQNRTKNWCLQNNHQVVSQVCGDSWPLEPKEVREQFNEWSRIERINHQNAHPGYKFSPSKTTAAKTPKRKASEERDSEASDLEDFDWEKGEAKRQRRTPRSAPRQLENKSKSISRSPYVNSRDVSEEPSFNSHNKSSYEANNPGKPVPPPYSESTLGHGQYYQQQVHRNTLSPGTVEDVMIRKTAVPGIHYHGLPGGFSYNAMDQYEPNHDLLTPSHDLLTPDQRIDPSLMANSLLTYDNGLVDQDATYPGGDFQNDPLWHGLYSTGEQDLPGLHQGLGDGQYLPLQEQQMHMLKGGHDGWSVEPLDIGNEFDKWMDEV